MLYETKLSTSTIILPGKNQGGEGRKDFQFASFFAKAKQKEKAPILH